MLSSSQRKHQQGKVDYEDEGVNSDNYQQDKVNQKDQGVNIYPCLCVLEDSSVNSYNYQQGKIDYEDQFVTEYIFLVNPSLEKSLVNSDNYYNGHYQLDNVGYEDKGVT